MAHGSWSFEDCGSTFMMPRCSSLLYRTLKGVLEAKSGKSSITIQLHIQTALECGEPRESAGGRNAPGSLRLCSLLIIYSGDLSLGVLSESAAWCIVSQEKQDEASGQSPVAEVEWRLSPRWVLSLSANSEQILCGTDFPQDRSRVHHLLTSAPSGA